ncbi:MAG: NAD(P)H-hydrate dehydratase, partial [Dysgonamonadaceae bacterium]
TKFAHKGTQGHALIIGGSLGKIGAVSLASKAALKSGCGLVTAYVPECGLIPLQSNFPEAMVIQDHNPTHISSISFDIKPDAIAIGMGMGKHEETQQALQQFLHYNQTPLVVDADALNILSENSYWLSMLQSNTILTPHPGELSRLIGHWENGFQKIELTRAFAQKYQVIVVVKGAHTLIIDSTHIYVNSSGTPALATAGSGDVLSGILAGLLAQGYDPMEAAQVGVYIHGMTATITSDEINPRAFIAGDIIDNIGRAYNRLDFHEE